MFQVKICGITNFEDAAAAVQAGADAIGLNFFEGSKRFVDMATAREIVAGIGREAAKVGVFVNHSGEEVQSVCQELRLDHAQLHGDEPPQQLIRLKGVPIIKAFRICDRNIAAIKDYVDEVLQAGALLRGILIDAFVPGEFGGTGQVADWPAVHELKSIYPQLHVVLAGGLTHDNVAAAIRAAQPDAVDVASGVEVHPRQKNIAAVTAFVTAARQAFQKCSPVAHSAISGEPRVDRNG